MPQANRMGAVYVQTGNPDTVNSSELHAPGELGLAYQSGNSDRCYQIVQLDSGATAATPAGAVAANQLAYWKDKAAKVVTNDSRFAMAGAASTGYGSFAAGIIRNAATPGNFIHVLQKGLNIPVLDGGNTFAIGEQVFAEATATDKAFDRVAVGTAPTYRSLGVARGAAANGLVNIDLDIPNIP